MDVRPARADAAAARLLMAEYLDEIAGRMGPGFDRSRYVDAAPEEVRERELDLLGRQLSWLSLALGALVAIIGLLRGLAPGRLLQSSLALAIAGMFAFG